MTIQEAIKSGKRYKLPGWDHWYGETPYNVEVKQYANFELVRDDWEIEEEKIEITREQLYQAINRVGLTNTLWTQCRLAEELGFKS